MKIELRIQQYHGWTDRQTHIHTEWLLELLVGAKNLSDLTKYVAVVAETDWTSRQQKF